MKNFMCTRCHKRPAVIFMSRMENGQMVNEGLCLQCAKELGIPQGKDLIDRYMRKKGYDPRELLKNVFVNKAVKALGYKNTDELYTQLSNGGSLQSKLVSLLLGYDEEENHAEAAEK